MSRDEIGNKTNMGESAGNQVIQGQQAATKHNTKRLSVGLPAYHPQIAARSLQEQQLHIV